MNARCNTIPTSNGEAEEEENKDEASVSNAVPPPKAMVHVVHIAIMYENAAHDKASEFSCPTIKTLTVWREFCKA